MQNKELKLLNEEEALTALGRDGFVKYAFSTQGLTAHDYKFLPKISSLRQLLSYHKDGISFFSLEEAKPDNSEVKKKEEELPKIQDNNNRVVGDFTGHCDLDPYSEPTYERYTRQDPTDVTVSNQDRLYYYNKVEMERLMGIMDTYYKKTKIK